MNKALILAGRLDDLANKIRAACIFPMQSAMECEQLAEMAREISHGSMQCNRHPEATVTCEDCEKETYWGV